MEKEAVAGRIDEQDDAVQMDRQAGLDGVSGQHAHAGRGRDDRNGGINSAADADPMVNARAAITRDSRIRTHPDRSRPQLLLNIVEFAWNTRRQSPLVVC